MRLVSGFDRQKFWRLVNDHVIHAALHRAKQVMVKVRDVDSLVDHQVERPPGLWVSVSYHSANGLISSGAEGFIIPQNGNWSIIVEGNKRMPS